jgi:hypothetical protein
MFTEDYEQSRKGILKVVYTAAGKYNKQARKESWFESMGFTKELELLIEHTSFLNQYNPKIRERVYYIENYIQETQYCKYCNVEKLQYKVSPSSLHKRCGRTECKRLHLGVKSKQMWDNRTEEHKQAIKKAISNKNKGRKLSDECIERLRTAQTGKKQSEETKKKRYLSRKGNGKEWHTSETKSKIAKSNSIIHSSEEYKEKYKDLRVVASKKTSETMIRNIQEGKFTPCITNSWTKWEAFSVDSFGNIKKFRSTWEAVFYLLNPKLEYESVRILYEIEGKTKNYIVDFKDAENKILYEIKPDDQSNTEANKIKEKAALKWCEDNGYTYTKITNSWFKENANRIDYEQNPQLKSPMKQFLNEK